MLTLNDAIKTNNPDANSEGSDFRNEFEQERVANKDLTHAGIIITLLFVSSYLLLLLVVIIYYRTYYYHLFHHKYYHRELITQILFMHAGV